MVMPPFQGPRLKIQRARKHINDLKDVLIDFFGRVQLRHELIRTTEHKQNIWRARFTEPCPPDVPILIGDAVHNLRASLDIMVCDIARLRGKSTDKLKFPFAADAEKLEVMLTGQKSDIKRLGVDVTAQIRAMAPHKGQGGNVALRGLHDLDILDKHELVIPLFLVAWHRVEIPGTNMLEWLSQQIGHDLTRMAGPVMEGMEHLTGEGLAPDTFIKPVTAPIPTFPKGLPFEGRAVLETLEGLAKLADDIVTIFEGKFSDGNLKSHGAPSGERHPVSDG